MYLSTSNLLKLAPVHGVIARRITVTTVYGLFALGQALLTGHILFSLVGGATLLSLAWPLAGLAVAVIVRVALSRFDVVESARASAEVGSFLRQGILAQLMSIGPLHLQRETTGHLQSSMTDSIEAIEAYVIKYLPRLAGLFIVPFLVVAITVTLSPVLAAILLLAIGGTIFSRQIWTRIVGDRRRHYWASNQVMTARIIDALQGMATLRAFTAETQFGRQLAEDAWRLFEATMAQIRVTLVHSVFGSLSTSIGTTAVIGLGTLLHYQGGISSYQLVILLFLTGECMRPVGEFAKAFHHGYGGMLALEAVNEFLDAKQDVATALPTSTSKDVAISPQPDIEISKLTVAYPQANSVALRDISLSIPYGMHIAIVGSSGAGKTTLANVLMGLVSLREGRVTIGGVEQEAIPPAQLRNLIAYVPQDTYLFHGSIRDNLLIAREGADDATLSAALRTARANEFVASLPQGIDTVIGERGARLSGGQRQRLAIARAVLRDAPIIILDEATASVDIDNEDAIHAALEDLTQGRTVIVIAHRLSAVAHCDVLALIRDGCLIDLGSHDELRRRQPFYRTMFGADELETT